MKGYLNTFDEISIILKTLVILDLASDRKIHWKCAKYIENTNLIDFYTDSCYVKWKICKTNSVEAYSLPACKCHPWKKKSLTNAVQTLVNNFL